MNFVKFGRIRRCLCLAYGFSYPPSQPAPRRAKVTSMIPDAFESQKKYSQSVRKKSPAGRMMKPLDDHKFRMQLLSKHWQPLSVASKFFQR